MRNDDFDPDETEIEEDQDIKSKEYKFKKGNTLDYYNEDLSRKAVGRLFEDKDEDNTSIVKGYDEDKSQEFIPHLVDDVDSESSFEQAPETHERNNDFVKGYVKASLPRTTPQKATSAYRPLVKTPQSAKESPSMRHTEDSDEDDAFSLYRKKEKKSEVHARPAVKITRDQKPETRAVKKPIPESDIENDKKPIEDDYDGLRETYKKREYIPSSSQPRSTRKPTAESSYPNEYYNEYDNEATGFSGLKIVIAVICFIFMLILVILIFQINSTKSQLKEAQAALVTAEEGSKELQSVKILYEALEKEAAVVKDELETLKSSIVVPSEDTQSDITDQTGQTDQNASPTGENTYIVQSGDSLSKISLKFYNTESEYKKIKDANNLENDSISPGQVLIIPPK